MMLGTRGAGGTRSYLGEVLLDQPLHYWRLNETSGTTATDYGSGGKNGTYVGTPALDAGDLGSGGSSVNFDASDDEVRCGTPNIDALTNVTIECLFKADSFSDSILFKEGGNNNGLGIGFYNSNLSATVRGSSVKRAEWATSNLGLGAVCHVVMVVDGTTGRLALYVDGTQVAELLEAIPAHNGSCEAMIASAYCIGAFQSPISGGSVAERFNGQISEVAIYNKVLSAARIQAHANAAGIVFTAGGVFSGSVSNSTMCSASSEFSGTFPATKAFDGTAASGDSNNCWISTAANAPNPGGSCYLQWNFGAAKEITAIRMNRRSDAGTENFPKTIKILADDDPGFGTATVVAASISLEDVAFDAWTPWKAISSPVSKQYLRVEIHDEWLSGTANAWVAVQEVEFKEMP